MSMMRCFCCDEVVDSDEHPENCPKCYGPLYAEETKREPPADFMEQLERMSGNEDPT